MSPKNMTKQQIKIILLQWEAHHKSIKEVEDGLKKVFDFNCESKLGNTIYKLWDDYTKLVCQVVNDDFNWLDWYCWENDMGTRQLGVKLDKWKRFKKIKNIDDLAMVIFEDLQNKSEINKEKETNLA